MNSNFAASAGRSMPRMAPAPDACNVNSHQLERTFRNASGRPFCRSWNMALPPLNQLAQHGQEIGPARGRVVLLTLRPLEIAATFNQSVLFKALESVSEDITRDPFG